MSEEDLFLIYTFHRSFGAYWKLESGTDLIRYIQELLDYRKFEGKDLHDKVSDG